MYKDIKIILIKIIFNLKNQNKIYSLTLNKVY